MLNFMQFLHSVNHICIKCITIMDTEKHFGCISKMCRAFHVLPLLQKEKTIEEYVAMELQMHWLDSLVCRISGEKTLFGGILSTKTKKRRCLTILQAPSTLCQVLDIDIRLRLLYFKGVSSTHGMFGSYWQLCSYPQQMSKVKKKS